ncbi:MAG TPA: peptidylprolyl isomerase [Saprospiraceae bacterium]|nr:peptidylprolyl isomerase [Saprospiraceae bacterium]
MARFQFLLSLIAAILLVSCNTGPKKTKDGETLVEITTNMGKMTVKLYNSTPKHRDNFIKLVKEGYYNELLFHRVINGFMIQGGDPHSKNAAPGAMLGGGGPDYNIEPEFGRKHFKGVLAAARLSDAQNPRKRSSGSQFYIVQGRPVSSSDLQGFAAQKGIQYTQEEINKYAQVGGAPFLDNEYTAFGEVVDGLEVIDKIAAVRTNEANRPEQDIRMQIKLL